MLTIEKCQAKDLQEILSLYHQLHKDEGEEITPERQKAFTKIINSEDNYLMAAKDGDKIIATAHLTILNNLSRNGRPGAYVENVIVDADYRGKGIGEKLIAAVTAKAQELGCYKVLLCTGTINNSELNDNQERRRRFYLKCGFKDDIKEAFINYLDTNI